MSFAEDFNQMLEEDEGGVGQWVVIRHFTDEHSEFWNEETKEPVGGPAFKFVDTVVLASKQPAFSPARPSARTGITHLEHSGASLTTYRYFFRADVTIKEDDEILDLDAVGQETPTVDYTGTGTGAKVIAKYTVRFVNPYVQGGRGELGYNLIIADREHAR